MPDLTGYAHALGCAQASWRFANSELRRAAAFAAISAAWVTFVRDAGTGDVGPAHDIAAQDTSLLFSEDPRRDAVLLWLADHGAPAVAEAAGAVADMVGATRRFATGEQALLDAVRDALADPATAAPGPIGTIIAGGSASAGPVVDGVTRLAMAVDRLRADAGFAEGEGAEVSHALPGGTFSRYVPAEPAGCWALNLALLADRSSIAAALPPPGLVSRFVFRTNVELEDVAAHLVASASAAWRGAYERLLELEAELERGRSALTAFSRNARTRDAWLFVAAFGGCTRAQIARALGLSRAGADIQARALAKVGLVALSPGGRLAVLAAHTAAAPQSLDQGPLSSAIGDLDASLANVDRLLARLGG